MQPRQLPDTLAQQPTQQRLFRVRILASADRGPDGRMQLRLLPAAAEALRRGQAPQS